MNFKRSCHIISYVTCSYRRGQPQFKSPASLGKSCLFNCQTPELTKIGHLSIYLYQGVSDHRKVSLEPKKYIKYNFALINHNIFMKTNMLIFLSSNHSRKFVWRKILDCCYLLEFFSVAEICFLDLHLVKRFWNLDFKTVYSTKSRCWTLSAHFCVKLLQIIQKSIFQEC